MPSSMFADCQFRLNPHRWLKTAARTSLAAGSAGCPAPAGGRAEGIRRPDAPRQVRKKTAEDQKDPLTRGPMRVMMWQLS